jgi:hypothetical protein
MSRRERYQAEWRAQQAATDKAEPVVVDLATVLDEARRRAASNPEPNKKISTEIPPRDEHRGAGSAKQQPSTAEQPRSIAKPYLEPEPVVEASRALVVVPQGEPVAKPTLLEWMNTKHHVIGNSAGSVSY